VTTSHAPTTTGSPRRDQQQAVDAGLARRRVAEFGQKWQPAHPRLEFMATQFRRSLDSIASAASSAPGGGTGPEPDCEATRRRDGAAARKVQRKQRVGERNLSRGLVLVVHGDGRGQRQRSPLVWCCAPSAFWRAGWPSSSLSGRLAAGRGQSPGDLSAMPVPLQSAGGRLSPGETRTAQDRQ